MHKDFKTPNSMVPMLLVTLCLGFAGTTLASEGYWGPKRVAVVGAGAAGLTAARTLIELGHEAVVFEKEDRVGGQVFTFRTSPGTVIELGAVLVTADDYPITLGYAEEFGIPTVESPNDQLILDESGSKLTFEEFLASRYTRKEVARATANYASMLEEFSDFIAAPGLTDLHPHLTLPFSEFAARYGIEPIAELVRAVMVGFGYGYYETVPAAYYVKFIPFLVKVGPAGLETATPRIFPTGFQSVFDALAATMDVRLSSAVTHIQRPRRHCMGHCQVTVTVNGTERHKFDAVVIATPLKTLRHFLDLTDWERRLINRVQANRYFVTTFGALGLKTGESLYFLENAHPERINHVGVWTSRSNPDEIFVGNGYQIAGRGVAASDVIGILAGDVAEQGGAFGGVLVQQEWPDYFPHVSPESLDLGFYDLIEARQGRHRTYLVGSSFTFESVEHAARHARAVIEKHFGN
jgi:hypothetical protein